MKNISKNPFVLRALALSVVASSMLIPSGLRAANISLSANISFSDYVSASIESVREIKTETEFNSFITSNIKIFGASQQMSMIMASCPASDSCRNTSLLGKEGINVLQVGVFDNQNIDNNIIIRGGGNDANSQEKTAFNSAKTSKFAGKKEKSDVEILVVYL